MPGETTIDSLQIEIQAGAKNAEQGLDALKGALDKLRSALKDGAGLTSLAASFRNMGDEANKLGTTSAAHIEKLVQALRDLQGVGKLNLTETANGIEKVNNSSEKAAANSGNVVRRLLITYASLRGIGRTIASLIDKSNTYVENLNLFNASLGQYADSARNYAQQVADLMGIDPAQWLRTQGVFQTLAEGFGVTSDRAIIMSKNLTQLGYDLSSFFNIAVDGVGGSMQKLQAAFSGELEPLRRLGFDLSEARLKAVALSLGIDQTFNSMTQAQKAQLRYYAILTQVTTAQGDMARTLDTPANQLRIFKAQVEQAGRALGNIFIPALNAILPYAIAATQAIRMVADAIAELIGFKMPEIDYSGISGATNATEDLDSALTSAGGSAKKLKDLLADWDELNIIQSESGGGSGKGGKGVINPEDWKFDLPEYDFLKNFTESRVGKILEGWKPTIQWITDHVEEIARIAEGIGATLVAWKIAGGLIPGLKEASGYLTTLLGAVGVITTVTGSIKLNIDFTTNWLETGNWGSLFGELITSVGGSSLVASIIKHIVTGEKGAAMADWAAGTLLTVNGAIGIALSVKKASVDGLDETTVLRMLTGGLEVAGGTALIYRQIAKWITGTPASGAQAIGAGAAAFFALANIGLNLGLTKGYLTSGDPIKLLESLGSDALSAAGVGTAVGVAFKSKEAGFIATGIVFAADAVMDLVLNIGDVVENGVTKENVFSAIKSVLEASAAAGMISSFAIKGKMDSVTALGTGAAAFSATVGISLSAFISDYTVDSDDVGNAAGLSGVGLISDALTSFAAGYMVYSTTGNAKHGWVIGGITIGIEAAVTTIEISNKVAETGEVSPSVIAAGFKSILDGALSGMAIGMSVGHPVAGAITGLLATASITVLAVVTGLEKSTKREDLAKFTISYGENALTDEEIQQYISGLFSYDVNAQIKTITAVVTSSTKINKELKDDNNFLETQLKAIELGVDVDGSYENIKALLSGDDGLIAKLNQYMKDSSNAIKAWITIGDVEGKKGASFVNMDSILSADAQLAKDLTWAGTQLADLITKGMEDELTAKEAELRDALINFISNVTSAAIKGRAEGEFAAGVAGLKLKDLTEESVFKTLEGYQALEEQLLTSLEDLQTETLAGYFGKRGAYQAEADAWSALHPGEELPAYLKTILDDLDTSISDLTDNWDAYLQQDKDRMVAPARQELYEQMMEFIDTTAIAEMVASRFQFAKNNLAGYGKTISDEDLANIFMNAEDQGKFGGWAWKALDEYLKGNLATYQKAFIELGLGDAFNEQMMKVFQSALLESGNAEGIFDPVKEEFDTLKSSIESEPIVLDFTAASQWTHDTEGRTVSIVLPSKSTSGGGGAPVMDSRFVSKGMGATQSGYIIQSTAVSGNEQNQQNVAAGVREGNDEQNTLLREQNTILRGILAKTGTVIPSTALARTVKRSNEMLSGVEGAVAAFAAGL